MTKFPRYAVSRCRKDNQLYGKTHWADEWQKTLCGLTADDKWFILANRYNLEASCPKCKQILEGRD